MSLLVLIVDDEPLARRRLRRLLNLHEDVEVVGEATNGDEAVRAALEARPDALFMDVRMPGSDGLEALRQLRDKLPADVVPMVVLYGPGLSAPAETWEAQPSVIPAATGVSAGRPSSAARSSVTRPARAPGTCTAGNAASETPSFPSMKSGQRSLSRS